MTSFLQIETKISPKFGVGDDNDDFQQNKPALEIDETGRVFPAAGISDFDDICGDEPPTGDCSGGQSNDVPAIPKYYWHNTLKSCAMFFYKGCGGSNIFDTKLECELRCNKNRKS